MARLRYLTNEDLKRNRPDIYQYFLTQRGKQPGNTHLLMANAPNLLAPFLQLGDAVQENSLDPRLRELTQMMVSYIAGKDYVWVHHYERAIELGITARQLEDIGRYETSAQFDAADRAVLRYVEEAMRLSVSAETFGRVRDLLGSDEAMMEFIMSVAFFNFSTYVHLPCEIDIEPDYTHLPTASDIRRGVSRSRD